MSILQLSGQGICDSTLVITPISDICIMSDSDEIQLTASHPNGDFYGPNVLKSGKLRPYGLAPGTYSVSYIIVEDNCSVSTSANFTIIGPNVNIDIFGTLDCSATNPNPVTLFSDYSGSGFYFWETPDGNTLFNQVEDVTIGGTYYFTIDDPNFSCLTSIEVEIPQTGLPALNPRGCDDCSQNLGLEVDTVPSNGSVIWYNPEISLATFGQCATLPTFTDHSGIWDVRVTGFDHGCVGTSQIYVPATGEPVPSINAGSSISILCGGGPGALLGAFNNTDWDFEYTWTTNTGNFVDDPAGDLTPYVDAPGIYYFEVTNPFTGCTSVDSTQVFLVAPTSFLQETICGGTSLLGYTETGTYIDTIPLMNGCDSIRVLDLIVLDTLFIEANTIGDDGTGNGAAIISVTGPDGPYVYQWSNGIVGLEPTLSDLEEGPYSVTITSGAGCVGTINFDILLDSVLGGATASVEGNVFFDANNNCTLDPGEIGFPYNPTSISGDLNYGRSTDENGNFQYPIMMGSFALEAEVPSPLWEPCNPLIPFNINNNFDTLNVNYPMRPLVWSPWMQVEINTPFLRRCFENIYTVTYTNNGTISATDVEIEINFDSDLDLVGSPVAYTNITGNLYSFYIGTVEVGATSSFPVSVIPNCASTIPGQLHCVEAHIYPDTIPDLSNLNWPNALITVEGECINEEDIEFRIRNVGNGPTSMPLDYIVIEDAVLLNSGTFDLLAGEDEVVTIPATGSTLWLRAEQEPGAPGNEFPGIAIEGCGENGSGTFSTNFGNDFIYDDLGNFEDTECHQNIGSYDPNIKTAFPNGFTASNYIEDGSSIEYQIQFQNTGTDTAFKIVLIDTISTHLNLASFEMISSSHPYQYEVRPDRTLIFTFDPIALVDSTTNGPGSMGFVRFNLTPNEGLMPGTKIYNHADIYFDFNAPVRTPTIFHTIWEGTSIEVLTTVIYPNKKETKVNVFPNPFSTQTTVQIEGDFTGEFDFQLFNSLGQIVYEKRSMEPSFNINPINLAPGTYFYQIKNDKELIATGKILSF